MLLCVASSLRRNTFSLPHAELLLLSLKEIGYSLLEWLQRRLQLQPIPRDLPLRDAVSAWGSRAHTCWRYVIVADKQWPISRRTNSWRYWTCKAEVRLDIAGCWTEMLFDKWANSVLKGWVTVAEPARVTAWLLVFRHTTKWIYETLLLKVKYFFLILIKSNPIFYVHFR